MTQINPLKQEFVAPLNKLVHMYLPSSGQKYSNRLLITKMSSPRAMNIQFNNQTIQLSLHSRQKSEEKQKKNRNLNFRISLNQKSKVIDMAEGALSARYEDKASLEDKDIFLSTRDEHLKSNRERDILERWKSLHVARQPRNNQKNVLNKDIEKQVRISISRMLQQSTDKASFQYITKFYKKPIERQMAVRKVKRESKSISEVLNVTEYKPHSQMKNRFFKTIEPRCRCHKNTNSVDMKRLNNTSYLTKRPKEQQNEDKSKPRTCVNGTRKILTLSIPDNWAVESWNTQSKAFNDQGIFNND